MLPAAATAMSPLLVAKLMARFSSDDGVGRLKLMLMTLAPFWVA